MRCCQISSTVHTRGKTNASSSSSVLFLLLLSTVQQRAEALAKLEALFVRSGLRCKSCKEKYTFSAWASGPADIWMVKFPERGKAQVLVK